MYKLNLEILGYEMHSNSVAEHQRNMSYWKFTMEK